MASNLEVGRVGAMLLVLQNEQPPTNPEWGKFLSALSESRPEFEHLKVLIVTDGGGPNAEQRKHLAETLGGRSVRVAVVSDSIKVRFVASMIALFHKEHRSFLKSEFRRACNHLGMTPREIEMAQDALEEMTATMVASERIAR
jgi:hypothetical protein